METTKRFVLVRLALAFSLIAPLGLRAQEAASTPTGPPADPSLILKAIPADAAAFVALRNVKELDDDVQTTWKNLKLPENVVPSLVDMIRGGIKAGKEFNANGSIALVVLNLSEVKTAEDIQKHVALLFPSTDPATMATAMGGEKDGDVVKLNLAGKDSVAAVKDKFLVVAQDEAALKSVLKDKEGVIKSLKPESQKTFKDADVFLWANFRGVSKDLRKLAMDKLQELGAAGGMGPLMAMQKDNMAQLDKFFDEADIFTLGASLNPTKGLVLNFGVVMKADSEMGKQMAEQKPAAEPLLIGLPDEPTVLAFGMASNPNAAEGIRKMFDSLLSAEGTNDKVDKDKLAKVRDLIVDCIKSLQQASVGLSGLPSETGEGMVGLTVVAAVKDSKEYIGHVRQLFSTARDLIVDSAKKSGESEDNIKKVSDAIQWKEDAEKVGEANVDQLTVDLTKLPDMEADTIEQVKKIVGKEGILIRVATTGPKHVVITFGGGAKRFETISGLAAKGEAPLANNAGIKKVADRLPAAPRLTEGYLAVDQLLETVTSIATEIGSPVPIPLAMRNSAPLAFTSVKLGETGQQGELLIPIEFMKSAADMVRPLLAMFMGGGRPTPSGEPGQLN